MATVYGPWSELATLYYLRQGAPPSIYFDDSRRKVLVDWPDPPGVPTPGYKTEVAILPPGGLVRSFSLHGERPFVLATDPVPGTYFTARWRPYWASTYKINGQPQSIGYGPWSAWATVEYQP